MSAYLQALSTTQVNRAVAQLCASGGAPVEAITRWNTEWETEASQRTDTGDFILDSASRSGQLLTPCGVHAVRTGGLSDHCGGSGESMFRNRQYLAVHRHP